MTIVFAERRIVPMPRQMRAGYLRDLARNWDDWGKFSAVLLEAWAGVSPEAHEWLEFRAALAMNDEIRDGLITWHAIDPHLTCADRTEAARDIAGARLGAAEKDLLRVIGTRDETEETRGGTEQ